MRFMLSQSLAQVPVKYVSVQCKGGLLTVLYGIRLICFIQPIVAILEYSVYHLKKRKSCRPRDATHWCTKHRNKLHVGMLLAGLQSKETSI